MFKPTLAVIAAVLVLALPAAAQQVADPGYTPKLERPGYTEHGPIVAIDEAHRNFHTLAGRYAPFARLLTADGYSVSASKAPLSAETLAGVDALVIANARVTAPATSAFTAEEVVAIRAWVETGGGLLLIADHAPFGGAAADLARAFGVDMGEGYVAVREDGKVTFAVDYSGKRLGDHPILHGRRKGEKIRHVRSFMGQSLGVPDGAVALLDLPTDALEVASTSQIAQLRQGQTVPGKPAGGRAQAVALTIGKGRVVIAGEAAMFSAQMNSRPNRAAKQMGLMVADDQQFALNTLHWLSHLME
jgi:hypothetical protein